VNGPTPAEGLFPPIRLQHLQLDPAVWPRQRLDDDRVAEFAAHYEEGGPNALPPIQAVDQELMLLSDGFTRYAAAAVAGLDALPTIIVELPEGADPVRFAYVRAIGASTGGAKQLTRVEVHAAIRRLIAESELSDADIALLVGVSKATVWRERRRAAGVSDETQPAHLGEEYTAQTTAEQVALRLFKGLGKVYESRGLGVWDALTGRRVGDRLADVLAEAYGDKALKNAERFRDWFDHAIASLSNGDPR
jgi:hypothetical protein